MPHPVRRIVLPLLAAVLASSVLTLVLQHVGALQLQQPVEHRTPRLICRSGADFMQLAVDPAGTVYVQDKSDEISAVSLQGQVLWESQKIWCQDLVSAPGGGMYGCTYQGTLFLGTPDGKVRWQDEVFSLAQQQAQKRDDGHVPYVGPLAANAAGIWLCVDYFPTAYHSDGTLAFRNQVPQSEGMAEVFLGPAGISYFKGMDLVYAYSPSGAQLAKFALDGRAFAADLAQPQVYLYHQGVLEAQDLQQRKLWQQELELKDMAPEPRGGLYCLTREGLLLAFDLKGRKLWQTHRPGETLLADGAGPLLLNEGSMLSAFDRATGHRLWDCTPPPGRAGVPAVDSFCAAPGGAVFTANNTQLYAVP